VRPPRAARIHPKARNHLEQQPGQRFGSHIRAGGQVLALVVLRVKADPSLGAVAEAAELETEHVEVVASALRVTGPGERRLTVRNRRSGGRRPRRVWASICRLR
jgi:hypothetical protein